MLTLRSRFISFTYRAMGAAVLDRGAFEEIEHHPSATIQAAAVVLASSLAAGIGASAWHLARPMVLLEVAAVAFTSWIAWVVLILQIGGRELPERETHVTFGELLRTVGFAASPGILQVLAAFPSITIPVYVASWVWMLAAMTVAVRQALDYQSFGRALAVCGLALLLVLAAAFVLALLFVRVAG